MGSAKVPNVQPHLPMAEEKKSIKNILKKPFQALFQKNKKKERIKEKDKIEPNIEVPKPDDNNVSTPVSDILDKLEKLDLENKNVSDNEDEFDNFSYKIIKDEVREKRNDSHSSEDSGFAEKCINNNGTDFEDENDRDLVDSFEKLSVDQHQVIDSKDVKKPKRLQKVVLPRGPITSSTRRDHAKSAHPYCNVTSKAQIVVCGLQTMAGGQVIVNSNIRTPENCSDIETALKLVDMSVTNFAQNSQQELADRWQIAMEYVNGADQYEPDDMLSEFISDFDSINPEITYFPPNKPPTPNPVEEFSNTSHTFDYDIDLPIIDGSLEKTSILLTPPRSENMSSPMSDSQTSFYPTIDYTLSPDTSSPIHNSDYEKYQDISPIEDYPSCVTDYIESDKETDKKKEKSSMTMKQFKDLQKQIATDFSKKECCQINRKSCKVIFEEHIHKLDIDQRKNICYKVANLDFKTAYGVLHHILFNLSNDKDEDINMALFSLICEKVLALRPLLFVEDFGLNILKLAVLRCYTRPLLTRYIVQCIRAVTKSEAYKRTTEYVFSEVDTLGDNLVIACARAGDECADVLSELVRCEDNDIPLFNIHHANSDGYTALHVCCAEHHSVRAPHAHALHVLLRHAGADLWCTDIKGGDTPLHVAVNSPNCDLTIVMILFQHIDRKEWRRLAHVHNRSSVNPLEYARSAVKSTTRKNYPVEVLDFLKKCR